MSRARILADYVSSGDELAAVATTANAALPKAGGAMTGAITTNSTFDGIDIATRDAVLTSTTTLATAAAPKASPAFTGTPTGITAAHLTGAAVLPAAVTGGSGLDGSQAGTGAFEARIASGTWTALANDAVLTFDNVSTGDSFDTDGNYTTGTSRYTAPADGVYLFWLAIYTAYEDTTNGFSFFKNSAEIDFQADGSNWLTSMTGTTDDIILTATIVIPLDATDYIQVCANQATNYYSPYSQWGGCRLR